MSEEKLSRNLKSRHIQMIAIGGSIGVGLFLYSAKTIQLTGPSVLVNYGIIGLLIYIILRSLGEMAVENPVSGSFSAYANKYLSPAFGYITGWSYWFLWVFAVMAEITAVGMYMNYWIPKEVVPGWVWALISLLLITIINLTNVKIFGELEFWFALVKVVTILALIGVGSVLIIMSLFNSETSISFSNLWNFGGFFPKGIWSFVMALGPVTVSFIGVESIGLTAGEAKDPEKTIPNAINKVILRVSLFYIGSLFIIMVLFPWNNINPEESPFVLAFEKVGLKSAAGIINFVVLTASISACNSGIFSSSRMALNLQTNKLAPKFLGKINKKSIPVYSVLFSTFFMLFGVLLFKIFPEKAFHLICNICCITGILIWAIILITQISFRKKLTKEQVSKLQYKSILFPYANYFCIAVLAIIIALCAINPEFRLAVFVVPIWILLLLISYLIQKNIRNKRNLEELNKIEIEN